MDDSIAKENGVSTERKVKKDKSKRKDDKSVESVMKALDHLPSQEEKLAALRSKYAELFDESKKQQQIEKRLIAIQREKDQLQADHTKAIVTRARLEQLCRELQKQNKAMKEESILKIREEEEKRKEVAAKFNATMTEIAGLMQQNSESNSKLRDENLSIQSQFKGVCEQYELREQQVEKMGQQMKLESQLAEAKLAKARLELQAQQEMMERDKALLMGEVARCQAKCIEHEKTEVSLRAQINVYFEKYDEFHKVLNKSNQVYGGFKSEMEKMSKKITRLEKETATWKQKWEGTHKSLLALSAEKQIKDNEVAQQSRQLTQLQKLCRTLQAERTSLLLQLTAAGIVPSKGNESQLESEMQNTIPELPTESAQSGTASAPAETTSTRQPQKSPVAPSTFKSESSSHSAKSEKVGVNGVDSTEQISKIADEVKSTANNIESTKDGAVSEGPAAVVAVPSPSSQLNVVENVCKVDASKSISKSKVDSPTSKVVSPTKTAQNENCSSSEMDSALIEKDTSEDIDKVALAEKSDAVAVDKSDPHKIVEIAIKQTVTPFTATNDNVSLPKEVVPKPTKEIVPPTAAKDVSPVENVVSIPVPSKEIDLENAPSTNEIGSSSLKLTSKKEDLPSSKTEIVVDTNDTRPETVRVEKTVTSNTEPRVPTPDASQDVLLQDAPVTVAAIGEPLSAPVKEKTPPVTPVQSPPSKSPPAPASASTSPKPADKAPQPKKTSPGVTDTKKGKDGGKRRKK